MASQRVAVVVGVGPGIGVSAAKRFAREGFAVGLFSRSREKLEPVEQAIVKAGGKALSVPCDAGNRDDIKRGFQEVRDKLGHPSVLIYNAGPSLSWPPPKIMDVTPEILETAMGPGVYGALYCAQEVLPHMVEAGEGTIIYTGATASLRGSVGFVPLAVPKFALRGLVQSIAREFHPKGIHVSHVLIDGQVALERTMTKFKDRPEDSFLDPAAVADVYWSLHTQHKTTWTHELDLRPYVEKF